MKGIIYKVDLGGEIYVGSTTTKLSKRQANHNSDLRKGKFTDKHKLYSKCVEKNIENIKCIWVEDYNFQKIEHLRQREEYYRKNFNEIVGGSILNTNRCKNSYKDDLDSNKKHKEKGAERRKILDKYRSSIRYSCLYCKEELSLQHRTRHERTQRHCNNILDDVLDKWDFNKNNLIYNKCL